MKIFYVCVCIFIWVFPFSAFALVNINEIAWMGSGDSANDEWIELYNSGDSSISLDGWTLEDGMNLGIVLTGTIGAGQYAVLERTDDTSASGPAFLTYTGALTNAGATLVLHSADGAIKDQVAGGEGWENLGGDNVTKETAQYTPSGWITAAPTPGMVNAVTEMIDESEEDDAQEGNTGVTKKSSAEKQTVQLELPDVELSLSIDAPDIVYVNQEVSFAVAPSGIGKTFIDSLQYQWNFGDAYTDLYRETSHTFAYPGEYVVTVYAAYARHAQIARKTITVLPVTFSITQNLRGDIQVHNNAKYEINISGYTLEGGKKIVFPEHTILLPHATVTLTKEKILSSGTSYVQLLDQEYSLVAALNLGIGSTDISLTSIHETSVADITQSSQKNLEDFIFTNELSNKPEEDDAFPAVQKNDIIPTADEVEKTKQQFPKEAVPFLGLIGVLSVGLLGVYMRKV